MKSLAGRFRRSLPARLLLVFVITSLLVTVLVVRMLVHAVGSQWQHNVKPHLEQYLVYVNADIGNPPDQQRAEQLAQNLPINIYIIGADQDYSSTGLPLDISDIKFRKDTRSVQIQQRNPTGDGQLPAEVTVSVGGDDTRSVMRAEVGAYQVYYELHKRNRPLRDRVVGRTLFGMLILLAICYFLIRRMLRPVHDIKAGAHRIGRGELDYRVPIRANNDLGELAGTINTMAGDIEKMLDAKRQLLLGVSHELRSPLTRATIATELLDESTNRSRIQEDLREMEILITEILETERMNSRHSVINRTPINLERIVSSVLQELPETRTRTDIESGLPEVNLDETRIRLLLRNLLSNAVKHGGKGPTPPAIKIRGEGDNLIIEVSDSGPGIPEEHLSRLTEPFYRVDPSRTRATGGFGLGLYLCKVISEAHGGSLSITSAPGEGTKVTVVLPRNVA